MVRLDVRIVMLASAMLTTGVEPDAAGQRTAVVWRIDNVRQIAGHPVTIIGQPRPVDTDIGRAVAFDGRGDGLVLDVNLLAGLVRFTVEVVFQPAPGGAEEQRFLHFEEPATGHRALIELRQRPDSRWSLDTYLRSGETGLTLLDRQRTHPAGGWHVAALTFDGRTMTHFVNRERELTGQISFPPLGMGKTSIGVRQNRVSWFKGLIHSIRVTPESLPAERLMAVPEAP